MEEEKKKKKNLKPIIIILAILFVIMVIVVIVLLKFYEQEKLSEDLDNIKSLIEDKDYSTATEKLNKLSNTTQEDENIKQQLNELTDKVKKEEIEEYKNNQEVTVVSATKHKEWYSDTTSGVQVIVKNNTQKVVKSYVVSVLAYDSAGYPLKIEYNNFEKLVKADGANIQEGKTYGEDNYCDIYYNQEKIESSLACVKKVEYYDGSSWENPYYQYWIEEHKEKPLQ